MSEADKMFEKLGYKLKIDAPTNFRYQDKENNKEIRFWRIYKFIEVEDFEDNSMFLSMPELQAINKKVEELGWN